MAFGKYKDDDSASTLQHRDYKYATDLVVAPAVMMHIRGGVEKDAKGRKAGKGPLLSYELSATLDATQPWTLFEPRAFRKATRARSTEDPETWVDDGTANTLNTFDLGDTRTTHAVAANYGVRRLTPVECERLQAFPDGWTEPAGSDSARYKALGNAVTVNTVRWVLGRMLEADRTIKEGTNE